MNFAEKLRTMRKQFGMSQEQLAEKINVSRQAVTKWETDGGIPDIENILAISTLFNVSVDELLSAEKSIHRAADFFYESVTEYDIDNEKHYDIHAYGAAEITVVSTESEKLIVRLASNVISALESGFKVKLDDHKSRIDVDIKRADNVSETQSKEALYIFIHVPSKFLGDIDLSASAGVLRIQNIKIRNFEFDGKVSSVYINGAKGHLDLSSSSDMNVVCDSIDGRIDINQINATSAIHIPKGSVYISKKKGNSNRIFYTSDGNPADAPINDGNANNVIELAGLNSELVINEYTKYPMGV